MLFSAALSIKTGQTDLEGGDTIAYKGLDIPVPVLAPVPGGLCTNDGGTYARRH